MSGSAGIQPRLPPGQPTVRAEKPRLLLGRKFLFSNVLRRSCLLLSPEIKLQITMSERDLGMETGVPRRLATTCSSQSFPVMIGQWADWVNGLASAVSTSGAATPVVPGSRDLVTIIAALALAVAALRDFIPAIVDRLIGLMKLLDDIAIDARARLPRRPRSA